MTHNYTSNDVVHETENHWVLRLPNNLGFSVFRKDPLGAVKCTHIGFFNGLGKQFAIDECERREALLNEPLTNKDDRYGFAN